jgi:hypothetical protein
MLLLSDLLSIYIIMVILECDNWQSLKSTLAANFTYEKSNCFARFTGVSCSPPTRLVVKLSSLGVAALDVPFFVSFNHHLLVQLLVSYLETILCWD